MIAVVRQMKSRKGSVKTSRQAVTDTWSDPDSQSAGLLAKQRLGSLDYVTDPFPGFLYFLSVHNSPMDFDDRCYHHGQLL